MSECIGSGCTQPDCHDNAPSTTPEEARRQLGALLGINPEKFAAMNRAERRAAAREHRRGASRP